MGSDLVSHLRRKAPTLPRLDRTTRMSLAEEPTNLDRLQTELCRQLGRSHINIVPSERWSRRRPRPAGLQRRRIGLPRDGFAGDALPPYRPGVRQSPCWANMCRGEVRPPLRISVPSRRRRRRADLRRGRRPGRQPSVLSDQASGLVGERTWRPAHSGSRLAERGTRSRVGGSRPPASPVQYGDLAPGSLTSPGR